MVAATQNPFETLRDEKFVNLETYRKDGRGVRTPLWFVLQDTTLYMRTPIDSFKVRRIRNNPRVRLAPCKMRGELKGPWFEARAEVHDARDMEWVNSLVRRKYGIFKRIMDLRARLRGLRYAVIAVRLDDASVTPQQPPQ